MIRVRLAMLVCAVLGLVAAAPVAPLRATFSYWDHHWFVWLPRDQEFEAAEIHANDTGGSGGKPLLWAYFTQRALPKTQTNYTNDAALAQARHWIYRDIGYEITGKRGEPRGVSATFNDDRGRTVVIKMAFAPQSMLGTDGAGVTDQMGHGATGAFLLLYRAATGTPQSSSVSIDGVDVSAPVPGKPDPAPFHAAYSPDTVNAAILFGDFTAPQNGPPADVQTDDTGRTKAYRLHNGSHLLTIAFDPPLPAMGTVTEQTSTFAISVDDLGRLEGGSVSVHGAPASTILDWHPDTPAWTRDYPFQTRLVNTAGGAITLNARTLRPAP